MLWNRRSGLLALGAALLPLAPYRAHAAPDPAEPVRLLEQALAGRGEGPPTAAVVRAAVDRSFDMDAVARAVLGAAKADPARFARFRSALADRMANDLLKRRRAEGRGVLDFVGQPTLVAGIWRVQSRIRLPRGQQRSVVWRVRAGPGGPRIEDVYGAGASMVRVLKNEHDPALRRLGLDGLIAEMEAKNRRERQAQ